MDYSSGGTTFIVTSIYKKSFYVLFSEFDATYIIDTNVLYGAFKAQVEKLIKTARRQPSNTYFIDRTLWLDEEAAPMFDEAPANCVLPYAWGPYISYKEGSRRFWGKP